MVYLDRQVLPNVQAALLVKSDAGYTGLALTDSLDAGLVGEDFHRRVGGVRLDFREFQVRRNNIGVSRVFWGCPMVYPEGKDIVLSLIHI